MKTKNMARIIILFILLTFSTCVFAQVEESTLVVSGNGEVSAEPDLALFNVSVTTEGKTANEALRSNATNAQKLIDVLLSAGIAKKDIETSNINVNPVYDSNTNGIVTGELNKIIGYEANNSLQVKVREISNLGQIIDVVVEAGDYTVGGISFSIEKQESFEAEALKKAVADARRKAEIVASAAGKTISGIKNINVGGGISFGFKGGLTAAEAATPILPGELTVSSSVTIKYFLN